MGTDAADPSGKPGDAVWLEHLRWVMDREQQQADRAYQGLWAIAGVQGVIVGLVAPLVLSMNSFGSYFAVASMTANALGIATILVGGRPRKGEDLAIAQMQDWWKERASGRALRNPAARFSADLIADRTSGDPGPIQSARSARIARLERIRPAIALTLVSVLLLLAGIMIEKFA